MGIARYLFCGGTIGQDIKEFAALKRSIKRADRMVDEFYDAICYTCDVSEEKHTITSKCVVSKMEVAYLVNEVGEGVSYLSTRYCKSFVDGCHCKVMTCANLSKNHRYNDAVVYRSSLLEQKHKFWKEKFANVK